MDNDHFLSTLDEIYIRYGYEVKRHHKGARVYIFTKSLYNGADIIKIGSDDEVERIKKDYADQGYAVKIKDYKSSKEAETDLFKDFFKADGVITSLRRRYENFVNRLMEKLPSNAEYQYINCSYDYTLFNGVSQVAEEHSFSGTDYGNSLVKKVVHLLQNHEGPLFIIIEAAAGYGKTCSAYEILNEFLHLETSKLPFFTELSRDRKATIFKHILLNEIEQQFSRSVTSDVVVDEIKSGRIPLIIDGFDELIAKDFSFDTTEFQQVESMLSTIVDLLSGEAKIIITSRKTAIFNSEEFHKWMEGKDLNYSLLRISISEPTIENWLSEERLDVVYEARLPIEQFANPVLLTYMRYVDVQKLREIVVEKKSIVEEYFNFLLDREQIRQGIPIEPDTQLRIFKKLVRLFTEYDIKSTSKDDLKDLIVEYNRRILEDAVKKYTSDKRPNIGQLADTLTNHAFLDRKDNQSIGFVNEFIFGTLIAENLINDDYGRHRKNFHEELGQSFSMLALEAFRVQPREKKEQLWNVYNTHPFNYEQQFFFKIDVDLANKIERRFSQATFNNFELKEIFFLNSGQFCDSTFTNCVFRSCIFNLRAFVNCSFVNCRFYDCEYEGQMPQTSTDNIVFYGGYSNNHFDISNNYDQEQLVTEEINYERIILEMYFKKGTLKARHRPLSQVRQDLKEYNQKEIDKTLKKLELGRLIATNGNNSYITQEGVTYFNNNFGKVLANGSPINN